jgi:two-component system sensor histidine kinase/response regulator
MQKNSECIKKFVKIGSTSSILLMALIEDILDLSKLEAGTFSINKSSFNLVELMNEVYDIFDIQCKQKNLKLLLDIDERLVDMETCSDRGRIKQILLNLMSNSFKFTFSGSISLGVKLVSTAEGRELTFIVNDTGIGIKKEDQKKLFKLFGMVKNTNNLNPNGCGIGLTVSQKYLEKLGGAIYLESSYGRGT